MKIELGKQYRTRDGREVRIYAVDGKDEWSVHGAIKNPNGWHSTIWMADGTWCEIETPIDLIEVKPRIKRKVWVNVYDDWERPSSYYPTKELADFHCSDLRIACVEIDIDVEEGHGL